MWVRIPRRVVLRVMVASPRIGIVRTSLCALARAGVMIRSLRSCALDTTGTCGLCIVKIWVSEVRKLSDNN